MRTRAARLYVSPRTRPLNAEEQETRRIAYALKEPTAAAVEVAAREMARLIDGPCWLVPVPTSRGSIVSGMRNAAQAALDHARASGRSRPVTAALE